MMTSQFKDVVQVKKAKEQNALANVKRDILTDSMAQKAREKVDI